MVEEFKVPSINYTSRSYRELREDSISRINFFTREWTDHDPKDPGIVLLQLFAANYDVGNYYLDEKLRENFITHVRGRRTASYLGALIGQKLKGKSPATVNADFTLQNLQVNETPIPIGTIVSTVGINPPQFYETIEYAEIPPNILTVTGVPLVAGRTVSAIIGTSDGEPYQEFLITNTDSVLDEGISVEIDGESWTEIEALGQAGPSEKVWSYRRDGFGQVYIQFGNGTVNGGNGLIPEAGLDIEVFWREGGGRQSSVGKGYIRTVVSEILSGGQPVSISCNNPKAAIGGDEEESVKTARKRMPKAYKSNNRGVTAEDYEALAAGIPGVVDASAHVTGIATWTVYILPNPAVGVGQDVDIFGYEVLSDIEQSQNALAEFVQERLAGKNMSTDTVIVKVVRYRPIDIITEVELYPGTNKTETEILLAQYVSNYFDPRNLSIGNSITFNGDSHVSDWDAGIKKIRGVKRVNTSQYQLRPQIETIQAIGEPLFDTISYSKFTTEAFWEILFLDNLTYRVYKQDLGSETKIAQTDIGSLGAAFIDDNNEVEIVVTVPNGNVSPVSGDRFRFRSSRIRGSVRMLDGDIAAAGNINFTLVGGSNA